MKFISTKQKIFNAIEKGKLKLIEGDKRWHNYIISTTFLCVSINNIDGFCVNILDLNSSFIESFFIESRSIFEYGGVHNTMILID